MPTHGPGRRHLKTLSAHRGRQRRSGGVGMGCCGLWIRRRRRCGICGGVEGGIGGDGGGRGDERDRGRRDGREESDRDPDGIEMVGGWRWTDVTKYNHS